VGQSSPRSKFFLKSFWAFVSTRHWFPFYNYYSFFYLLSWRINDSYAEVLKGLRCYFDKALPAMLLYKKERDQYTEEVKGDVSPSTVYGAEHLLRLFGMSYCQLHETLLCFWFILWSFPSVSVWYSCRSHRQLCSFLRLAVVFPLRHLFISFLPYLLVVRTCLRDKNGIFATDCIMAADTATL
jgi:hypothetical protein